jgi:hypothetical protein
VMADSTGEADIEALRFDWDRRLVLHSRTAAITSDAGLHAVEGPVRNHQQVTTLHHAMQRSSASVGADDMPRKPFRDGTVVVIGNCDDRHPPAV